MKRLKDKILLDFPGLPIVTLMDLCEKISVIATVRTGNNRDFSDYAEVTLSDVDEYGVIRLPESTRKMENANKNAVMAQALNYGDLLVSYRALRRVKSARVGKHYDKTIVGNTTLIKVRFKKELPKDVSSFVQAYLDLEYVQRYLISKCISNKQKNRHPRFILSPEFLRELPIPKFEAKENLEFEEYYKHRYFIEDFSKKIHRQAGSILCKNGALLEESLFLYENRHNILPKLMQEDRILIDKLKIVKKELDELEEMVCLYRGE